MTADPAASDPGPRPEEEKLTNEQTIAKYAPLRDSDVERTILAEMVYARKLSIAVDRKAKKEREADEAWQTAYMKKYGTDEG